ncbi:MAG TPA: acetyl-CoA C-acetyltransferase [Candidatus Baltobacteraceae bacterium]|nr:acetyl-CoA C-acetyltransferase [Candidatus Baltobacteraceae bacterium]
MPAIYLVDGVRTAIGNFRGSLSNVSAVELGRIVVAELLLRTGVPAETVDEVLIGCILQAGQGENVARQIAIHAGIPKEKTAMTVNMLCGSGLRAVCLAAQAIAAGDAACLIAGGTESMSNAPYLLMKARTGYALGNGELVDSLIHDGLLDAFHQYHMGVTAENLAVRYGLTREMQDAFAADSQQKAERAQAAGRFKEEIILVAIPQRKGDPVLVETDEFPRPGTTVEVLAKLRPAFKQDGTVTAGNASGINDGAAALLVADEAVVARHGLAPLARIVSYAYAGTDPSIMGIGPVQAVRDALAKARWTLDDLDLIEANEAFAAQSLAVAQDLGFDSDKLNVNGGAIALGHPVGASGARVLVTLLYEMRRRGARKGLATLCIGGGMGIAMCVERD